MILKFDHISLSCSDELDVENYIPDHYTEAFRDMELDNISCKMKYLKFKSPKHNIIMLVPQKPDAIGVPIEITQYPEVSDTSTALYFKGNTVFWEVADIKSARDLFLSLGAQETEDEKSLILSPFLDKRQFLIRLVENTASTQESFLDVEGFSSIGLFVDNIQKHLDRCADAGFPISDISPIRVQGKWMNIAFVEGKNGELVELISSRKEKCRNENNRSKLHNR